MKWIGERISFVDDKNKTTIVIYPENASVMKTLMGAWMFMWIAVGGIIFWSFSVFTFTDQELIILVVFLTFWFYYAVKVVRSWSWLMWGKELIKIDKIALTYKKSVRDFGKATPYYIENIKGLRLHIPKEKSVQSAWEKSIWIKGGERYEFDYLGRLVRFGRKVNQKDAEILFRLITKRVEGFQRMAKD